MKISPKPGIDPGTLWAKGSRHIENSAEKRKGPGGGASAFDRLLADTVKAVTENADSSWPPSPLARDRLRHLVETMKMAMNDYLCRAVEGTQQDFMPKELSADWLDFAEALGRGKSGASNIQHPFPQANAVLSQLEVGEIIDHASEQYGVSGYLIRAVIKAESGFDPNSTSSKGAMGLMQLMPDTARELGVKNPYDPSENVMGGTRYLKGLLDRYGGNIPLALAAYNWGMGNVERNPDSLPHETRTYIARVNDYYREQRKA